MALRKQTITIQAAEIDSALTDFPVLITRVHLDDEIVDPSGSNNAQADGGDLKFYSDEELTSRLAIDPPQFGHDSVTGAGDAPIQVWVKVPSISSTVNTVIWVTYNEDDVTSQPAVGDAFGRNAVWSNGAVGVYHLEQDPSGTSPQITDSSGNDNHGTTAGAMVSEDLVASQVGDGLDFDGVDQHAAVSSVFGVGTANVTVSTWVNLSSTSLKGAFVKIGQDNVDGYAIGVGSTTMDTLGNNLLGLYEGLRWLSSGVPIGTGWHHVALTIDASGAPSLFLDGVLVGTFPGGLPLTPTVVSKIAGGYRASPSNNRHFNGQSDDSRVYNRPLSTAEVAANYSNQFAPGTFAVAGTPEDEEETSSSSSSSSSISSSVSSSSSSSISSSVSSSSVSSSSVSSSSVSSSSVSSSSVSSSSSSSSAGMIDFPDGDIIASVGPTGKIVDSVGPSGITTNDP